MHREAFMRPSLENTLHFLKRMVVPASADDDASLVARFVADRDEKAFAELIRRHGPMVLGVCRRVLRDDHDTEDAFQATFLVLARKASSLRRRGSVGSFLHGVALRVASRARARRARQPASGSGLTLELFAAPLPTAEADLMIDDEIDRLPERYRAALVLCCLEGLSTAEAADRMGCTEDACRGRLWRARALLRSRLSRPGVTLTAVVSAELARRTSQAACAFAAGETVAGASATLAEGVLRMMTLSHWRSTTAVLLLTAVLAATTMVLNRPTPAAPAPNLPPAQAPIPEAGLVLPGKVWAVRSVAFSPDGKLIAAGCADGFVWIWNTASKDLRTFDKVPAPVFSVAFSPDGKTLAVSFGTFEMNDVVPFKGAVRLWDFDAAKSRTVAESRDEVRCAAYSPDGKTLAVGSTADRELTLWDVAGNKKTASLGRFDNYVHSVAFSPDGKRVATTTAGGPPVKGAAVEGQVLVWDVDGGKELLSERVGYSLQAQLAFGPDGNTLFVAGDAGLRAWDLTTGKVRFTSPGHPQGTRSVAVSPDGRTLVTGGPDRRVRLWDALTGEHLPALTGSESEVGPVAFSPDGKTVAAGTVNGEASEVRLWTVTPALAAAEKERGRVLPGKTTAVQAVAVSRDGKLLAAACGDRSAKVWDLTTGKEIHSLADHPEPVHGVAMSPDGKTLAVAFGSLDMAKPKEARGGVRLWDLGTGKARATVGETAAKMRAVAFSPDGSLLALGGTDQRVRLLDAASGKEKLALPEFHNFVSALAFSPDGRRLAAVTDEGFPVGGRPFPGELKVWEVPEGKERLSVTTSGFQFLSLAWSPDGKSLLAGEVDQATVWDAEAGKPRFTVGGQAGRLNAVAFSPDGKSLAAAGERGVIRLWDADGKERGFTRRAGGEVRGLAFTPDGKTLAVGDAGAVRLFDPTDDRRAWYFMPHEWEVHAVAVTPDGKLLAAATHHGIALWDMTTGRRLPDLRGHKFYVRGIAFSPDGKTLASACEDWSLKLWDVATGKEKATLWGHRGPVMDAVFSPDGKVLATSAIGWIQEQRKRWGDVKLWDAGTGKPLGEMKVEEEGVQNVVFSRDGKSLVAAMFGGGLRTWDVATTKETGDFGESANAIVTAVSPDAKTLATGGVKGVVWLWDAEKRQGLAAMEGHKGMVFAAAFSPDGRTLATAGEDGTIRLWDVAAKKERAVMRGHVRDVRGLAFFPDGKTLASCGDDKTVKLWDVATGQERPRP